MVWKIKRDLTHAAWVNSRYVS